MNQKEIKDFLEKFCLPESKIEEFLQERTLIEKNSNIYLLSKPFENKQVSGDTLLFIKLKRLLPSTYLLNYIAKNSKPIEILTENQALTFTYDKNLVLTAIKRYELKENIYYIITYKSQILGYCSYNPTLKFPIVNEFNIGEYLKEN